MFKIGDFSKLSRVSVKMLRHYDELGLLKPAYVDRFTDYRYYSVDQLPRLNRILALKDLGFTLEQIARVLDEEVTVEQLRGMLMLKRAEIEQHLRAALTRLSRVEARLQQIEREGALPAREVIVRDVEACLVASIRRVIDPRTEDVEPLFNEVENYVEQHKARAAKPPLMLYHDSEYHARLDVEVAVPLTAAIPASASVSVYTLPHVDAMACIIHTGSYATMGETAAELFRWVDAHDYRIAGPTREVFLRFGASGIDFELPPAYLTTEQAAFVTELQLPVSRK